MGYRRGYYGVDPAAENISRAAGVIGQLGLGLKRERRLQKQDEREEAKFEAWEEDREVEDQENKFLAQLNSDPKFRPPVESLKNPKTAKAWNSAEMSFLANQTQQEEYKQKVFQTRKAQMEQQHRVISSHVRTGIEHAKSNNFNDALANFEKAYEAHIDGADLVIGPDKKSYTINMPDGSKETKTFNSQRELLNHFVNEASGILDPGNYAQKYNQDRRDIDNLNATSMANAEYYTGKGGAEGRATTMINPYTGKKEMVYELWVDGVSQGSVDKKTFDKYNMQPVDIAGKKADIRYKKVSADKTTSEIKAQSPEGKLADDLWKIDRRLPADRRRFRSKDEAMNFALRIKSTKDRTKVLEFIAEEGLSMDIEEDRKLIEDLLKSVDNALPEQGAGIQKKENKKKNFVGDNENPLNLNF